MNNSGATQLLLFERREPGLSAREAVRSVEWSHSRRSVLEQCSRRYYYQYFGAGKNTSRKEPAKEMLHSLKTRVQNRYLVSGGVLHTVIKTYLTKAREGDRWEPGPASASARSSENVADWPHPDGAAPAVPTRTHPSALTAQDS